MRICDFISKEDILNYLKMIKPSLEREGIVKLALFGSFARGDAHLNSDIDILLQTSASFLENYPAFKAISRLEAIKKDISSHFGGIKVDICDLSGLKEGNVPQEAIYV